MSNDLFDLQSAKKRIPAVVEGNTIFAELFEEMFRIKKEIGDDFMKANAFAKVAAAIRNCPVLLESGKQIAQLKRKPETKAQVEGIGKSTGEVK